MRRISEIRRLGLGVIAMLMVLLAAACDDGTVFHPTRALADTGADSVGTVRNVSRAPASDAPARVAVDEPVGRPVVDEPVVKKRSADPRATFVVGDSTFVEAAAATGMGSAYSGHGFTQETPYGLWNPLDPPPDGYDGLVVIGVSLWDRWASDLSGYREATDFYRGLGLDVVWVEVPPADVRYTGGPLRSDFVALNQAVAEYLGCELQPWTLRNVETLGSVDGDPEGEFDWTHPTPRGGLEIAKNAATLTAEQACVPRTLA